MTDKQTPLDLAGRVEAHTGGDDYGLRMKIAEALEQWRSPYAQPSYAHRRATMQNELKQQQIDDAIKAFNESPDRPFDDVSGRKVFYRARRPILATDCDYEIVSFSGVQGRRM